MYFDPNVESLAAAHGVQPIGAAQRTIAFSAVASGGTGKLNWTAAAHALKKGMYLYNPAGAYAGIIRVTKIISANVFQTNGTFGATSSGTLALSGAGPIFGFWCDVAPTIAAVEPEAGNIDAATLIAMTFVPGTYYPIPCKSIRITAGNITVIPKPPQTDLPYGNR
jgi:hypothetical protein